MNLLNEKILEQSDFVTNIYETQARTFSAFEYPAMAETIRNYGVKSVLDVGTGDGSFISGFASLMPDVAFLGVDGDASLIQTASSRHTAHNLTFSHRIFDSCFPEDSFDLIHARFAVEHMTDIGLFAVEARKRLKPGGIIFLTEYHFEFVEDDDDTWKLFREKEREMHQRLGSRPFAPLIIPRRLKEAGFQRISSVFTHLTPTTMGAENFYETILSYVTGYSRIAPEVFTEEIREQITRYCINGGSGAPDSEDRLFLTRVIAVTDASRR